jgi:hypothetical protein
MVTIFFKLLGNQIEVIGTILKLIHMDKIVNGIVDIILLGFMIMFEWFTQVSTLSSYKIVGYTLVTTIIVALVVVTCILLRRCSSRLRPRYTIPFLSLTVAVLFKYDSIVHNDQGIVICFLVCMSWITVSVSLSIISYIYERRASEHHSNSALQEMIERGEAQRPQAVGGGGDLRRQQPQAGRGGDLRRQQPQPVRGGGGLRRQQHTVYSPLRTSDQKIKIYTPSTKTTGGRTIYSSDECPICLEPYIEDELKVLPCGHTCHIKCIDDYFRRSMIHKCPVCREPANSSGWFVKNLFL